MSTARPIVSSDCNGEIVRLDFRTGGEASPVAFTRLRCPRAAAPCSTCCAAIALVDLSDGAVGLVCQAFSPVVPLGVLDPDRLDLDLIETLRAGTQLREHLRATARRGAP